MGQNNIILPRRLYVLAGDKEQHQQINIYFRNVITGYYEDKIIEVKSDYGKQYRDFWRLEPGRSSIRQYDIQDGCFDLTIQIKDYDFNLVNEATTTIEVVPRSTMEECNLLCIGDSITRWGPYLEHLQSILPGVRSVGTRTYDNGKTNREGRGGWSAKSYLYKNYLTHPVDSIFHSPFMFPKGIEGNQYWGNTIFWKNVVSDEPEGYDYHGFQKLASGWQDEKGPYLFDDSGYPRNPGEGAVIFDPRKERGKNFLKWSGMGWIAISQPEWELSFEKYMECCQCAYMRNGVFCAPDVVSILFGANDIMNFNDLDSFVGSLEAMVSSIKNYRKDIKIIVNLPIIGSILNQANKTSQYYRRLMQEGGRRILEKWDNDQSLENQIYVGGMMIGVDPVYGYGRTQEPAFLYSDDTISMAGDSIHPSIEGHKQMGDLLAGLLQKIR